MFVIMKGKLHAPSLGLLSAVTLKDGTFICKHSASDARSAGWHIALGNGNYLRHDGNVYDSLGPNVAAWPTREKAVEFYSGWKERQRIARMIREHQQDVVRLTDERRKIADMQALTLVPEKESIKCINTCCKYHDVTDWTGCSTLEELEMSELCKLYFNK